MPDIRQIASESPILATPTGLRLPTDAVEMFRADGLNITPAVQSRLTSGFTLTAINAGAVQTILVASPGNYFIVNHLYIKSSLTDVVTILCGGVPIAQYVTNANENLIANFTPAGLFSGTVNSAITLRNDAAGVGTFSARVWGQYIPA